MKIDLTYELTKENIDKWIKNFSNEGHEKALMSAGHFGTHFDVMGKEFPLDYTESNGIIFDVSQIKNRDIEISDIEIEKINPNDFVLIHTGTIEKYEYGSKEYFNDFNELSFDLIEKLVSKEIRMIGIDSCGVRKGAEHPKADNFCAQNGVFVVENLVNLDKLLEYKDKNIKIHTYPVKLKGFSGLPSRVIAEI